MIGLLFWLGVIGLFLDWRYMRKGGVRPSAQEKKYLGMVVVLCVLVFGGLALLGGDAGALGALTNVLLVTIVALWSFRRFLIRRASPLPPNYGQLRAQGRDDGEGIRGDRDNARVIADMNAAFWFSLVGAVTGVAGGG